MARKRFNVGERALIDALAGKPVEWQNVTVWHPGTLTSATITRDESGWEWVDVDNKARTPRLSPGKVRVMPGHLRAPRPTPVVDDHPGYTG